MSSKRIPFFFIAIALVITLGGLGWGIASVINRIQASTPETSTPAENTAPGLPNLGEVKKLFKSQLATDAQGWTHFLFLGISGENYISGNLSDTIMVASVQQEQQKVNLISIPRDLWVSGPDGKFQKINELYTRGGGTEKPDVKATDIIRSKVEAITGLTAHYTVIINLEGIKEFVDFIGGLDTDEGHLNGSEALKYIRDRSRPGGDFDRMHRQQKFFVAVLQQQKAVALEGKNDEELQKLFEIFSKYFSTDLALLQLLNLDKTFHTINTKTIGLYTITPDTGLIYADQTLVNGLRVYTLHPKAGREDYSAIQTFIKQKLE